MEVGVGFSKTKRQTLCLRTGYMDPQKKNGRNFSAAQKHGFRGTDGAFHVVPGALSQEKSQLKTLLEVFFTVANYNADGLITES